MAAVEVLKAIVTERFLKSEIKNESKLRTNVMESANNQKTSVQKLQKHTSEMNLGPSTLNKGEL